MSNLNKIAATTIVALPLFLGCVTDSHVQKNLDAELIEWKVRLSSSSLDSTFPQYRLKFKAPLTAPFVIYSDLRCFKKSKTLELFKENRIEIPFNAPQGVYFEALNQWDNFKAEEVEICQIRFLDYDPKKSKNVNEGITVLKKLCLKPKIVEFADNPETQTLGGKVAVFAEVDAKECTFDI
ncbi:MAG: hypothetical protein EOP48_01550 [Sphingobacteriales bacterium]|nr:MAG: hypothetical protein EOP48_01550 [Sphingobacteriales bacterium]